MKRAREQLSAPESIRGQIEQQMLSALERLGNGDYAKRLVIKTGDRVMLLDVERVDWIEAAGKQVRVHSNQSSYLLRETLTHLETRLDPEKFVRIHRSSIVNLNAVLSFEPTFHGEFQFCLKDETRLTLSRSYRAKLRERFGNLI